MEKKIEDSKPILNRSRRQLLVGAALTPVVMTLHSAKVMADDVLHEKNPSGFAPYSGALKASAFMTEDGTTSSGTDESERVLYEKLCDNTDTRLRPYYGSVGNGKAGLTDTLSAWTYGEHGTMGASTPAGWTEDYEKQFVESINTSYMTSTNLTLLGNIQTAITNLNAGTRTVIAQTTVTTLKSAESSAGVASIQLPQGANTDKGVFKYVTDVKGLLSGLVNAYNSAALSYNTVNNLTAESEDYVPALTY